MTTLRITAFNDWRCFKSDFYKIYSNDVNVTCRYRQLDSHRFLLIRQATSLSATQLTRQLHSQTVIFSRLFRVLHQILRR